MDTLHGNVPLLEPKYTYVFLIASSSAGAFEIVAQDTDFSFSELDTAIDKYVKEEIYRRMEQLGEENNKYLKSQLLSLERAFEQEESEI